MKSDMAKSKPRKIREELLLTEEQEEMIVRAGYAFPLGGQDIVDLVAFFGFLASYGWEWRDVVARFLSTLDPPVKNKIMRNMGEIDCALRDRGGMMNRKKILKELDTLRTAGTDLDKRIMNLLDSKEYIDEVINELIEDRRIADVRRGQLFDMLELHKEEK